MFCDPAVAPNVFESLEEGVPRLGAKLTQYNPAGAPSYRSQVEETLKAADFINSLSTSVQPTGTNQSAVSQAADQSVAADQAVKGFNIQLGDQWTVKNAS